MTGGGAGGKDTDGAGSDDGTDGEGGNPPQAAVVNATTSSIPTLVSFKFAARFLNQHNYVKCAVMRMGRVRSGAAPRGSDEGARVSHDAAGRRREECRGAWVEPGRGSTAGRLT